MIEKDRVSIQDNFLPLGEFITLRDSIMNETFPWYFNPATVGFELKEKETCPGLFTHIVYFGGVPLSEFYPSFLSILDQMNVSVLTRIKLNLQTRLPEQDFATFHADTGFNERFASEWTVSILYINTNNGYTELKNTGQKVESIANRLVTFPGNF